MLFRSTEALNLSFAAELNEALKVILLSGVRQGELSQSREKLKVLEPF